MADTQAPNDYRMALSDFDYISFEKKRLKEAFDEMDKDKSGKVSKREIVEAKVLKEELTFADMDGDGEVSYDELWAFVKDKYYPKLGTPEENMADRLGMERWRLRNRFNELDKDKNGYLTMGEIYGIDQHLLDIFYLMDKDGDHKLTFDEMWAHVRDKMFVDVPEEVNLRVFFNECDADRSGFLSQQEIVESAYFKQHEELAKSLDNLMKMDTNKDGKVSIEEFLDNWRKIKRQKRTGGPIKISLNDYDELGRVRAKIREAFDKIDTDKSGKISKAEMKNAPEFQMELGLSDTDGDGEVTFEELWTVMKAAYYPELKPAEEVMADRLAQERWNLRQRFYAMDRDESGFLTIQEIRYNDQTFEDMFDEVDKNNDKKLSFDEMWAFVRDKMFVDVPEEVNLRAFFQECDTDGSGFLSYQEVCESNYYKENEELSKYLDYTMESDTNKDDQISIEEFLDNWRKMKRKEQTPTPPKREKPKTKGKQ